MKNMMLAVILPIVISGCLIKNDISFVCRHKALAVGVALGERYDTEIVLGTIERTKGLHAVARANINGEWVYYDLIGGKPRPICKIRMINEKVMCISDYLQYIEYVMHITRRAYEVERFEKLFR